MRTWVGDKNEKAFNATLLCTYVIVEMWITSFKNQIVYAKISIVIPKKICKK